MFYQKHIFMCINQKDSDKKCCQQVDAKNYAAYLKEQLIAKGLWGEGKMRLSTSGCLGRCALGPVLVIYPEGVWYTYHSFQDLDKILEKHLINGGQVKDLVLY